MALIIPPGFAQATIPLNHSLSSQDAVVTLGIDLVAFAGTDAAAADAVQTAWNNHMQSIIDSQVVMGPTSLIVGQDGTENTTAEGTISASGTRSATSVPPNVAALVTKRSSRGGRRGRGRMFVPWAIGTADVGEGGLMASVYRATFQTAASGFRTALATALVPMVILHSDGISAPALPNPVTSLTVEELVATQRRRLGR